MTGVLYKSKVKLVWLSCFMWRNRVAGMPVNVVELEEDCIFDGEICDVCNCTHLFFKKFQLIYINSCNTYT